jgi:DsbC/DsbD-like thiol-disulfide interchange protein
MAVWRRCRRPSSSIVTGKLLLFMSALLERMSILVKFRAYWMKSKRGFLAAACILCLPLCLLAQQNKLTVRPAEPITVKRGTNFLETLKIVVQPGFHVNSDKPKDEFIIPLKLTWSEGPLEAASTSYPKPEEIQVGSERLTVFTGTFNIQTEFKVPEHAQPGTTTMMGKLRYQACNDQMCLRPATVDVRVPVVIE